MALLTSEVQEIIGRVLPDRISIKFDNQTTPDTHWVRVFASFLALTVAVFDTDCLALSPMNDETTQSVG